MAGLRAVDGARAIDRRLAGGRPVLGICVGMQILFARGVEHGVETEGCDEWPGVVERLQAPVVPHMGWNTVEVPTGSRLFAGLEGERFYFVHSYAARAWDLRTDGHTRAPLVTWSEHGGDRFVSAVENGPLSATQFHPEKSGDAGAALLRNWVESPVIGRGWGVPSGSPADRGSLRLAAVATADKCQEPARRGVGGAGGTSAPGSEGAW